MTQGLKQQILAATSVDAITELLNVGKTYEFASNSTRNGWKNAARRKSAFLKGEKYIVPVSTEVIEEVVTPKKKRGNKKKESTFVS